MDFRSATFYSADQLLGIDGFRPHISAKLFGYPLLLRLKRWHALAGFVWDLARQVKVSA